MNDPKTQEFVKQLTESLAAQGRVIEGGWAALEYLTLKDASDLQRKEMRKAFFCGAQHLWASIFAILDGGTQETPKDLLRMDQIHAELQKFAEQLKCDGGFAA